MTALPTFDDIADLAEQRSPASVSLTLRTTPLSADVERHRLEFKNAVRDAEHQLEASGVSSADRSAVRSALESVADAGFWNHLSESVAIFATPEGAREFRVKNHLPNRVAVGDRFDVGPLLRSLAFSQAGYVLALSEGSVRLAELSPDRGVSEVPLELPDDLHTVLEYTQTDGQADMPRAQGATGEKIEQRKYCRLVQDAVLTAIGTTGRPLILAAAHDLQPVYREINTYAQLLASGIDANPASLSLADLEESARAGLDRHYAETLERWREDFGTLLSNGRGTVDLATIARAASQGAVADLLFDLEDTSEGTIAEDGTIVTAESASAATSGLLDEIAVRVLRTGGTVRAVRRSDLPGSAVAAAVLRFDVGR